MSARSAGRKVLGFLLHPLTLATLAALLVAALLWFAGPLLVIGAQRPLADPSARLIGILLVVLVWGIFAAVRGARRAGEEERLVRALRRREQEGRAADATVRAEAEARLGRIRGTLAETLARLGRERGLRFLRPRAYRSPWFLVIGPPGAGKSAMLLGARLPLPFGPPRVQAPDIEADCAVVFSDEAVFLDTNGRLTIPSAETGKADAEVWTRLLRLVRRLRRRQPVCGVFLVVDVAALAALGEEARREEAAGLRARLDEISEAFRARPPIYLVGTKLDRLVGFSAFFETLDPEERDQIWGLPLLDDEESLETSPDERFAAGFAALVKRAAAWQMRRLHEEADPRRRALIYEFPDQFAALGAVMKPLVRGLGAPHRFDRPPFLRGVFFASALQERMALDMIGGGVGRAFGQRGGLALPAEASQGPGARGFFLARAIGGLPLSEAGRRGVSAATRRFTASWQGVAAAALTVLTLVLASVWFARYHAAEAEAAEVDRRTQASLQALVAARPNPGLPPFPNILSALDELLALRGAGANAPPAIAAEARRAYAAGLERMLVPYLEGALREELAVDEPEPAKLFFYLKLYLALGGAGPPSSLDWARTAPQLGAAWMRVYSPEQRRSFETHVAELGSGTRRPGGIEPSLVESARRRLAAYTPSQLALDLARLRPEVAALPSWRPGEHAGASAELVLTRLNRESLWDGFPGFYTQAVFRRTALPAMRADAEQLARDAWVLSDSGVLSFDAIYEGMLGLYAADYIRQYDALLSELTVTPMASAAEGARALSRLVNAPSPIATLLAAVAAETDLSPPPAPADADGGADADGVGGVLAAVSAAGGAPAGAAEEERAASAVTEAFAPLRRAVLAAAEGQPSQVGAVLAAFEPLYRQLNHIATGGNILELGTEPQTVAAQIETAIALLPSAAQPFFTRLKTAATDLVKSNSGTRLKDVWASTVLPACLAATQNQFPFKPDAATDAPLEDVKAVFAPDGRIAAFRETYLKPLIDTSARPWVWRPGFPGDLGIKVGALQDFERADAITKALFPDGSGPAARFTLEVASLDARANVARLDIGGPVLRYAHGPAMPFAGQWPPAVPGAPAALSLTPEIDGGRNMLIGEGTWALFRLFDQASIRRRIDGNAILASFSLSGRAISVKLTPASTENPFELTLLNKFRCPRL